MAKKTVRTAKPTQQRSKEEQWRKRMAAQARTAPTTYPGGQGAGSAVVEPDEETYAPDGADFDDATVESPVVAAPAPRPTSQAPGRAAAVRPTTASRPASASPSSASVARRTATQTRPPSLNRGRIGATSQTMTIDEEMHYIRVDIRRLIILTAICLVILIALSFVVPSIIK